MRYVSILIVICCVTTRVVSQQITDTLYINAGNITLDSNSQQTFPFLAFNVSSNFSAKNSFLEKNPGATLQLSIVNNDSIAHTIQYRGGLQTWGTIQPGDTSTLLINVGQNGVYEISDSLESQRFIGLSTFLIVWPQVQNKFVWHLNEFQSNLNLKLREGISFDKDTFDPDYFTINDQVHPQIMHDTIARVRGRVGDSIYIFVFNSGKMSHSVHFHGYHVEIVASNSDTGEIGRIKDTIGILPRKYQIYLLIPFQPGIYPVHDHNLIATTGGGNYPNGMMVMMNISP